ncbi:MAG: sugar phosphate isomerase/epimerase [Clostridia bacterium]|nr:sugar phosphate isomerase/epimerase [Clostridia bacterium]
MNEILCSTGALIGRPNGRDFRLLGELSRQIRYDGFEFMMYSTWREQVDEIADFVNGLSVNVPVVHCEKGVGELISKGEFKEAFEVFEISCNIANRLGAKKMVVHLWGGLASDGNFENNLKGFKAISQTASERGIELLVENIVCNNKNPMARWSELRKAFPDVEFVFDTKMAEFHAQLPLLYSKEYEWLWKEERIKHIHVNDYSGGYMDWSRLKTLPVGKGQINFAEFFAFLRSVGYCGSFTAEGTAFDESGAVDTAMLAEQLALIKSF